MRDWEEREWPETVLLDGKGDLAWAKWIHNGAGMKAPLLVAVRGLKIVAAMG